MGKSLGGDRAFGNNRHFNHLGPPLEQIIGRAPGMAKRGLTHRAEGDVIRPCLGSVQPVMARITAERTDDSIGAKLFAGEADTARAVAQMHAIKPVALRKLDVILDHHGDVAGMGHLAAGIRHAAKRVLFPCPADTQTGYRNPVKHFCQQRRKGLGVGAHGRQKVKLGASLRILHRILLFSCPNSADERLLASPFLPR